MQSDLTERISHHMKKQNLKFDHNSSSHFSMTNDLLLEYLIMVNHRVIYVKCFEYRTNITNWVQLSLIERFRRIGVLRPR